MQGKTESTPGTGVSDSIPFCIRFHTPMGKGCKPGCSRSHLRPDYRTNGTICMGDHRADHASRKSVFKDRAMKL
eukprot:6757276-Heterocapsa_arctica.AAC.1